MGELSGKIALITGGAAGIGEGVAQLFAKEGAQLILADVISSRGQAVAKRLQDITKTVFFQTDVHEPSAVQNLIAYAQREFPRLDILVNNAGVEGKNDFIHEMPDAEFERVIAINLLGA